RNHRAGRTAAAVVRAEHEVIDDELRAAAEQFRQGRTAFLGVESVGLVDGHPGQRLPALRQLVAAPRELLLGLEQAAPRGKPLLPGTGQMFVHRLSPGSLRADGSLVRYSRVEPS